MGKRGLLPNEDFFVSKIFTEEGKMLSGRTLRRMERDFLLSSPPGQISGGIPLHDFSMLRRGETLAHTKPLTRTTCHLSTMEDPYFILRKDFEFFEENLNAFFSKISARSTS